MEPDMEPSVPAPLFKDGMNRNAARVPKEKWEEHKERLCSLYREKTVGEIIQYMRTEHDFVANAGQLGRKLREWGVYKYDSKNRPMDSVLAASEDDSVEHSLPEAPSTAVFHALSKGALTAVPESITILPVAHSRSLPDSNLKQLQNNAVKANKSPPPSGGSPIHVNKLPESPRIFDQLSSTEDGRTHHKHDAHIVGSAQADLRSIEGPQYGSQQDVNMDKLSIVSLVPSSISGFASLQSLARRIRTPQTARMSSDRKSVDDLPSGMMQWDKSSSHSLRLFGLFSSRLSIASSARTDTSQMSWKPEVQAIIPQDGGPKSVPSPSASTAPFGWPAGVNGLVVYQLQAGLGIKIWPNL